MGSCPGSFGLAALVTPGPALCGYFLVGRVDRFELPKINPLPLGIGKTQPFAELMGCRGPLVNRERLDVIDHRRRLVDIHPWSPRLDRKLDLLKNGGPLQTRHWRFRLSTVALRDVEVA